MPMKRMSLRTLRSSFWFWFVGALVVNQAALFAIFYGVLLKPASVMLSQVVGSVVEASVLAIKNDPQQKLSALQRSLASYEMITVVAGNDHFEKIPRYYVGMEIVRYSLESHDPTIHVGYAAIPEPMLLVRSDALPDVTFRVAFQGPLYVPRLLGMVLFLMILIGALAAFWISSRLVRPLQQLTDGALRLGKERDFHAITLASGASHEVEQLATTLNQMRAALDESMKERESLLAGVAHDLRTPLSRMRLALELEGAGNTELTNGLRDDVVEMSAVMAQFIELSRLNLEVDEPWAVGDLNQLLRDVQAKYRRGGIELSLDLGDALPSIRQKPLALTRLLYNLVDNAYRHGNGTMTIQTRCNDDKVVLTVANPVSEDDEATGLMRAFHDQSSGKTAGLGLSIVRRFAEVHAAELQETTGNGVREYRLVFQAA